MMEIDQVAALRTTLDFHLLFTQSNPRQKILPSTLDCTRAFMRKPMIHFGSAGKRF
jgi:hypothetical protein